MRRMQIEKPHQTLVGGKIVEQILTLLLMAGAIGSYTWLVFRYIPQMVARW
jgi:hypothetical protein